MDDLVTGADGLRLAHLRVMYDFAREVAAGEYPIGSDSAQAWIDALPAPLRARLDDLAPRA